MKKLARILFIIVGSVFPILVGALHTKVHFAELVIPKVQSDLSESLMIMGDPQMYYNTWGLMSFMMGISFIVIGLLNISIMNRLPKDAAPPISAIFAMMVYLVAALYAGSTFNALPQFYGSIFGMILMIICLILSLIRGDKQLLP